MSKLTHMFTAAVALIAPSWKHPSVPPWGNATAGESESRQQHAGQSLPPSRGKILTFTLAETWSRAAVKGQDILAASLTA